MSRFFGVCGEFPQETISKIDKEFPNARNKIRSKGLYAVCGGFQGTLFFGEIRGGDKYFLAGIPTVENDSGLKVADNADLQEALSRKDFSSDFIGGHFAICLIRKDRVELRVDRLGIKTLYAAKLGRAVYFCTELDVLSRVCGGFEVDPASFGSLWLLENKIAPTSVLKGVLRIGPGGKAIIKSGEIEYSAKPFLPGFESLSRNEFLEILDKLTNADLGDRGIKLALSGGFDSRLLLTLLLKNGKEFGAFSVGESAHPDLTIASEIAGFMKLDYNTFHVEKFNSNNLIDSLESFCAKTSATAPASEIAVKSLVCRAIEPRAAIIDGAFGEISGRGFFEKIAVFGKKAFSEKKSTKIFSIISVNGPDVFDPDFAREMRSGAIFELDEYFETAPSVEDTGFASALDLFAVRTKAANYNAFEQSRVDGFAFDFAPFQHPSYVDACLGIGVSRRKNAELSKKIIADYSPDLTKFPLVKGGAIVPFRLNNFQAKILAKAKSRFGNAYSSVLPVDFLNEIKEYVLDLFSSTEVVQSGVYDSKKLERIVRGFYSGKLKSASELDRVVAFEAFRRSLR